MIQFKEEFDSWNLWPPRNSDFKRNLEWLVDNGHDELRPGVIILASENSTVLVTIFSNKFRYLLSLRPKGDQAKYFIEIYQDKSLNGFYFKNFKKKKNQ